MQKISLNRYPAMAVGTVLLLALALAGCGGGGGGGSSTAPETLPPAAPPPTPPSGGTPLTSGVASVTGDWLQVACVAAGAQSFKKFLRATVSGGTSINYGEGVVTYSNTTCAGAGTRVGPSDLGVVTFSRSESNSSVAANWGSFKTIANTTSDVIWAKKSEAVLCLLGVASPTTIPTLADLAPILAVVSDLGCFTKQ